MITNKICQFYIIHVIIWPTPPTHSLDYIIFEWSLILSIENKNVTYIPEIKQKPDFVVK